MDTSTRAQLARELRGRAFAGDDPAAAPHLTGFNTSVTHRPGVLVTAESSEDVAAAVRHAVRSRLAVAVQATGHGAAAPVGDDTVLITTDALRDVEVDPERRVARVEAGVRWRQVIDAAAPHGLAPLNGSSSDVGVVGYTLGGGMGHLARRHGFAADHVRSLELVTAAGEIRTVTAESDPDLFWAVRGGQSSFGIVTALEFDLVPVPEFFGGALMFTGDAIETVLRSWAMWAPTLPEDATTSVALLRLPPIDDVPPPLRGVVSLAVRFGFAGSADAGETLIAPMRTVAEPTLGGIGPMPYAAVDAIHMDPTEPMPAVTRGGLLRELPPAAIDSLLAVAGPGVDVPLVMAELRLMGGALARAAAVPNAVAGREGAFAVTAIAPAPPPLAEVAPLVTSGVISALEPWSTGTNLVNFVGSSDPDAIRGAWTVDTLDRLRRVKAAVDPANVFGGALTAESTLEPTAVGA
ncbi:FAD-linked oxidase [Knoellia sinensis KCTC 19936]|uniref:FAD-linked oxidase n=1 Tax=Knoellia sinensis KCTC 19936 TaxID=1385520 RepID=A0A0A0JA18_9MICO|nr:FAD-dependent oxidoreductase [Knoellia sinensis]KGN34290.1 FAD-linked oxidase [Knoellia sinensis KCTC 19936]